MANSSIRLATDGAGKRIDTEELSVGGVVVHRERGQLAGANELEISRVLNADPAANDYGLVTRPVVWVAPVTDAQLSTALAAGGSVDLDAVLISNGLTGQLVSVLVSSSVPCRWEVKTRDNVTLVTKAVFFTELTYTWDTPHKSFIELVGDGVDNNFRVTATNLSSNLAADVYVTFMFDEKA